MPILQINTQHTLYPQVVDLRNRVLRIPLGLNLNQLDTAYDPRQVILVHTSQQNVVNGCLMLLPLTHSIIKMRQVAVDPDCQKTGIGKKLIREAEAFAREEGFTTISLHARCNVVRYYESLGYALDGEEFTEVGIPHQAMIKKW